VTSFRPLRTSMGHFKIASSTTSGSGIVKSELKISAHNTYINSASIYLMIMAANAYPDWKKLQDRESARSRRHRPTADQTASANGDSNVTNRPRGRTTTAVPWHPCKSWKTCPAACRTFDTPSQDLGKRNRTFLSLASQLPMSPGGWETDIRQQI